LRKQQSPFQKRFSACSDEEEERLVDERKGKQFAFSSLMAILFMRVSGSCGGHAQPCERFFSIPF